MPRNAACLFLALFALTACGKSDDAMLGTTVTDTLPGGMAERMEHPIMGAEDFSYVLEKVPGAMAFLGVAAEGADWAHCSGIHSSRMMVDETVLPRGAAILAGCATNPVTAHVWAEHSVWPQDP